MLLVLVEIIIRYEYGIPGLGIENLWAMRRFCKGLKEGRKVALDSAT